MIEIAPFDYFEESAKDIIGHLRPLFAKGACYVREDTKIGVRGINIWDVPWVYTVPEKEPYCILSRQVVFPHYGWIPSRCHKCWKVVVRPRALKELFALYELQKQLDLPSKVGLEERPQIHEIYGGYFYNDTLDKARQCKVVVERRVAADISPDIPIFIQRGCSEYEDKFPDTTAWKISREQKDIETHLAKWLVLETKKADQSELVIRNVKRKWIERACEVGHEYRQFSGGRPLYKTKMIY